MDHFPLMARFNRWVNARLYESVAKLSDEQYRKDVGLFFGSVHATLNHLLVGDLLVPDQPESPWIGWRESEVKQRFGGDLRYEKCASDR